MEEVGRPANVLLALTDFADAIIDQGLAAEARRREASNPAALQRVCLQPNETLGVCAAATCENKRR
jgi:hypothetical protein